MTDHPAAPPLAYRARLGELEECWLEVKCTVPTCNHYTTMMPIKLLVQRYGPHHPLGAIVQRLVCKGCRGRPSEVHLNESHTRHRYGGSDPGWSVQLHPLPASLNG